MITTLKLIFYKSVYIKEIYYIEKNIAKEIEDCIILIKIEKFVAIITDNANNIKLAWKILKKKYSNKIFLKYWIYGINL